MIYYFTAQEGKNYTVLGLLIFVNFFFLVWNFHQLILLVVSIIEAMLPLNILAGISNSKIKVYANQIKYIMVNLYL